MTKYKAGDEVTIRLTHNDAHMFNIKGCPPIGSYQIISHKPAPEPIVGWVDVYQYFGNNVYTSKEFADHYGNGRQALIKLTYNPSTKTATAEVVE